MSLKERITNDIKTALLGGDRFRGDVLKNFKAAILNEEVAKGKRDSGLEDSEIEVILAREIKKRNESAEVYKSAGRNELADNELAERDILNSYMPKQLSESEIKAIVEDVKSTIETPNIGQLIGAVKARVGNLADGALIARIVKESL